MRDYEVVYIFKSSLTTEEIEGRLEGHHAKILSLAGSEITAVEHWGKRQLAYPIDRNDTGYYVVTQFTASPAVLPDFERALKLDDDLLRHLVVLSEGELPMPVVDDRGDDDRGGDRVRRKSDDAATDTADAGDEAPDGDEAEVEAVDADDAEGDATEVEAGDADDAEVDAADDEASDEADKADEEAGDDADAERGN